LTAPDGGASGLAQALSAGRYAAFVWPAYGVTVLGFAWMIIDTLARARRWPRATLFVAPGDAGARQDRKGADRRALLGLQRDPAVRGEVAGP
jgi:heme exporter protein CcmD